MTDVAPGTQPPRLTLLGWILFVAFVVLLINIVEMPRTPLGQRENLYAFHFSLGLVLSLLALLRIYWWYKGPELRPPEGLPASSFAFHRAVLLALLATFVIETGIGTVYAWGIGETIEIFGIHVPSLMAKSEGTRMAWGYFHSAFGFYYLMLISIYLAYGIYQHVRYKSGLKRLFPGSKI